MSNTVAGRYSDSLRALPKLAPPSLSLLMTVRAFNTRGQLSSPTTSLSLGAYRMQTVLEKAASSFSLVVGASRLPFLKVAKLSPVLEIYSLSDGEAPRIWKGKSPGNVQDGEQGLTHRLRRVAGCRGVDCSCDLFPWAAWARPEGPRSLTAPLALGARTASAPTATFGV